MLRTCIALVGMSALALAAASQVAAVAATQVSDQVQQQATQIVNNVENGATVASQQVLPVPQGQNVLIINTVDAYVIVQNGVQTIVFKASARDKYDQMKYHTH